MRRKFLIVTILITGIFNIFALSSFAADGKKPAAPVLVPTKESVFVFISKDPPKGTAGFIVYRATLPSPDDKMGDGILNKLFTEATGGKTLEQLESEYNELAKTDPAAAERMKAEYQTLYDEKIKQKDMAMQADLEANLRRLSKGDLTDSDFTIITPEPVKPLKAPDKIMEALGPSAPDILSVMNLASPEMIWTDYADSKDKYETYMIYSIGINMIFGRVYEDRDVKPGGAYYYKIAYTDSAGKTLGVSEQMLIQVKPMDMPPMEGFAGEPKDGGAILTWNKPEKPVSLGVDVFRGANKEGPFDKVNKSVISFSGDPKYFDNSVNNDQVYYYYIAAADIAGNHSAPSPLIEILPRDMTPPAPPANVAVALKDGKVIMTWDMNLEPDMDVYYAYRGEDRDKPFATISQALQSDVTTFTDETIENGKMYFYQVAAVDKNANFSVHSVAVQLKLPDTVPPKTPLGFNGKPGGKNMIVLTWQQSKDPDLFGYNIYRGTSPDKMEIATPEALPKEKTKYEDFGVNSGVKYYYALMAVDTSMNESKLTEPILVAAPDSTPPTYPNGLFPMGQDSKVAVSWAPSQDSDLALYRLYVSSEEQGKFTRVGKDIPKEQLSVVDEPVENGKKRWYYLTAVDESGNESEPSGTVQALPMDPNPPAAPTGATGTISMKTVSLKWLANQEKDIAGYTVCRAAVSRTGVCETISGDKLLGRDTLAYPDKTLEPGVNYWYRIIATDTSDNNSGKSDPAGPFKYDPPQPVKATDKTPVTNAKSKK